MPILKRLGTWLAIGAAIALATGPSFGDEQDHPHPPGTPPHAHPKAPVRMTMEELHRHGGVPPGWRFTLPEGDPRAGREVFAKLECHACHEVKGESFPHAPEGATSVGPALTGMGTHHPAEYFAEAILSPNAVIVTGPGHVGPDGLSLMPDYRESLLVSELIDLVAYLKSLRGEHGPTSPGGQHGGWHGHGETGGAKEHH